MIPKFYPFYPFLSGALLLIRSVSVFCAEAVLEINFFLWAASTCYLGLVVLN